MLLNTDRQDMTAPRVVDRPDRAIGRGRIVGASGIASHFDRYAVGIRPAASVAQPLAPGVPHDMTSTSHATSGGLLRIGFKSMEQTLLEMAGAVDQYA
jgi:hypothetical protein